MYIQWCVKGIAGKAPPEFPEGLTCNEAFGLVSSGTGIVSNWWRNKITLQPHEHAPVLNDHNLDRHLHDYTKFASQTPFISLASGCVERDALLNRNVIHSAVDTALMFATEAWARPGALFYCWTPVSPNPAAEIWSVAEAVRELNVYHRWSPYQLEGEITAKLQVPANQIKLVEWWDGSKDQINPIHAFANTSFIDPAPVTNLRGLF
jgi:hypothetical protein